MSYFNDSAPTDRDEIRNAHHTQHNAAPAPRRVPREYTMTHKPRGRALIFNHKKFNSNLKLHKKKGTREDKERLETTFRNLGFLTEAYNDLTHQQIKDKLHEVSKEENSNYDCLVVVVMTHGSELNVEKQPMLFAKDKKYRESELWTPFNNGLCRTYRGKPKLFFLQVCRDDGKEDVLDESGKAQRDCQDKDKEPKTGKEDVLEESKKAQRECQDKEKEPKTRKEDVLDESGKAQRECQDKDKKPKTTKTYPENSDFLIVRSYYQDCPSFRDSQDSSIFIEKLCEELENDHRRENGKKKELNKILLTVHGTASEAARTLGGIPDDAEDPLMFTTEKSFSRFLFFRNVD